MTTSANNTESNKDSTQTNSGYSDEKKLEENNTPTDSNVDDFGYDKPEDTKEPETDGKPEGEPKPDEDEKVKDPATGYGDEPEGEPKPDDTKETDTDEKTSEEVIKTALGELPEGYNKDKMSKFALENKMTKEQVEAYVEFAKEEMSQFKKNQDTQTLETKKRNKEELMNDSVFGGELFEKNLDTVEKLLDKHMPNMKKRLTDTKGMLPPYIMKDLLGISKVLNPTTNIVKGDPGKVKEEEGNFLDVMYK